MSSKGLLALVGAAFATAALTATASAAGPERERIDLDETVVDEFLSDLCGFEVTTRFKGHIITRTFQDDGKGIVSVRTLNVVGTAMANGNDVRVHDVGADHIRVTPDGTAILSIIGQIPFFDAFIGLLRIDLTTGEVIHMPRHLTGGEAAVCAALAA